jgi:hypothetical protein
MFFFFSFGKWMSMSFFLFSCINTVFFSLIELFVLQYCFRHCAFCNLDWGITIYYHFNEFRCLANGRSDQGGCKAKWNNCIPQDIDTSCRYDNDPRWFPQAMYVTESHHIVLIKFSLLNRIDHLPNIEIHCLSDHIGGVS